MTLSINGVDYVSNKNIVSLETSWKNNIRLDQGFYPGSDFQTSGDGTTGAIRGRLEFGNRVGTLKFVALYDKNSTELTKLKAQTTGTAVIGLSTMRTTPSNSPGRRWLSPRWSSARPTSS